MQSKSLPINQKNGPNWSREKENIQEKSLRSKARIIKKSFPDFLARVHLLQPRTTLVQSPIDSSSDRQSSADNGADADEEAREGLGAGFAVDDFHGGDVLSNMLEQTILSGNGGRRDTYV